MKTFTHVLFDFFGTLVAYSESRVDQGFPRSHALLAANGADLSYAEFLTRWSTTFDELEDRAQRSLDEYSMDDVCSEFLWRVLARRPPYELMASFRDTYLSEWNKGVRHIPGVQELLASLAQQFVLVLITNTHHADLVHTHLREMKVAHHFTGVITSIEHGKRKPSPTIFAEALAQTGGSPERAAYIGDSFVADYRGATTAGLRCLLIDPEARHDIPLEDRVSHILEIRERLAR